MENEFIPHKEALALKELGFDEPCVGTYHDNNGGEIKFSFGMLQYPKRNSQANTVEGTFIGERGCYAPLYQQAFRWFRDKYGLNPHIEPHWEQEESRFIYRHSWFEVSEFNKVEVWQSIDWWLTYEEAELACLRKLIEIVEENKDE